MNLIVTKWSACLAGQFRLIRFTGLGLTAGGVAAAERVRTLATLDLDWSPFRHIVYGPIYPLDRKRRRWN